MALGAWKGKRWNQVWSNGYYAVHVCWDYAQDIEANATTIAVSGLRVTSIASGYTFTYSNCDCGIGDFFGKKYTEQLSVTVPAGGSWEHLTTPRSVSIRHNNDGTWSRGVYRGWVMFNSNLSGYNAPNTGWISFDVDNAGIPAIPRATRPTLSKTEPVMGETITINLPRNSSSFTHDIIYEFGSAKETIATNKETSYTWTVPLKLAEQIPRDVKGSGGIKVVTKNGSSVVGTIAVPFYPVVPDSVVPSISNYSISEAVSAVASIGAYVQGKSQLKVSFGDSGAYGSSIVSTQTWIGGYSYSGTSFTSGIIYQAGNINVQTTVTDSRGRKATVTRTINVLPYSPPTITKAEVVRASNAQGAIDDAGNFARVTYSYNVTNLNNKNVKNFKVEYLNGSTWTALKTITDSYSKSDEVIASTTAILPTDNAVVFRFTLQDSFASATVQRDVGPGFILMNFSANGKAMAIGRKCNAGKGLECGVRLIIDDEYWIGGIRHLEGDFRGDDGGVTNRWIKLGTLTSFAQSQNTIITLYTGDGYNARPDQNTIVHIAIKQSWQSSPSPTNACGCSYWLEGQYHNGFELQVRATSNSTCDVWVKMPWGYFNGEWAVRTHGAWEPSFAIQAGAPTSGTLQTVANHTPDMRGWPIGSIMTTEGNNNPANSVGGTWVRFATGRVLVGEGSSTDVNGNSVSFSGGTSGGQHYPIISSGNESAGYGLTQTAGFKDRVALVRSAATKLAPCMPPYQVVYYWKRTA